MRSDVDETPIGYSTSIRSSDFTMSTSSGIRKNGGVSDAYKLSMQKAKLNISESSDHIDDSDHSTGGLLGGEDRVGIRTVIVSLVLFIGGIVSLIITNIIISTCLILMNEYIY